jgi:hypothetical protein
MTEVTLAGMVMEAREVQPANAPLPIVVILEGMVMEVRAEQPENALLPTIVVYGET